MLKRYAQVFLHTLEANNDGDAPVIRTVGLERFDETEDHEALNRAMYAWFCENNRSGGAVPSRESLLTLLITETNTETNNIITITTCDIADSVEEFFAVVVKGYGTV